MAKDSCKRILIVSYYFPPSNYIGSLRAGKFAKYLEKYGWETWVLTLEKGIFNTQENLPIEIPESQIIRADITRCLKILASERKKINLFSENSSKDQVKKNRFYRRLIEKAYIKVSGLFTDMRFPDRAIPWVMPALKKGSCLLQDLDFNVILSSHGPPSSHIVASLLSKKFGIPWIADYRDLWSGNHLAKRVFLLEFLEKKFERFIIQNARCITTISAPIANELELTHGKPVYVLTNGFDAEDYIYRQEYDSSNSDCFNIVYTGSLYAGKRDPSSIFEAVSSLKVTHPAFGNLIKIHFYGSDQSLITTLSEKYNIFNNVVIHSKYPNQEIVKLQCSADVLLLLEWNHEDARGVYTGKLFEYLGAKRPILATGPKNGVIEKILSETSSGELVFDKAQAASFLITQWQRKSATGSTRIRANDNLIGKYTREYQAKKLIEIISIINSKSP